MLLASSLAGLWFAGLCAVLSWWQVTQQFNGRMGLAAFFVLLAGLAVRSRWNHSRGGHLAWDGAVWHWESPGYQTGTAEHKLAVIADFQHMLLLRLENQAGANLWLWLEKKAMPERWMDLRRAVYSPYKSSAALPSHDFLPGPASMAPTFEAALSPMAKIQSTAQEKP